jgi:DNA replication and repair protein RecF
MLGKALAAKRSADQFAGHTTVGPHRDDLMFFLNGQSVHAYASQGQQRTIALSLRLAEIDFIYQEIGEYPVLLLDDVLSELDDLRQKNLVLSMSEKVQTIITTASLFQLHDKLRNDARLFQVCSGIIQNEG